MTGSQIIVLASPVFFALIALELAVGIKRGRNTYRLHDAVASIGLGTLSQVGGLFTKLMTIGIYSAIFSQFALFELSASSPVVWVAALVAYDFCYYWHHRFGHRCALFWAAHVVHHQSEDYNLSTALRQTSSGWLVGWVAYVPLAIAGVPPVVFGTVALIDLLYQFWVHTQQINRLGWFDRWFCSPSNHRVHHAVNDAYLDKNYGGILIIWDRLFGTFKEEDDAEPCVYGTRSPLASFNPVWANLQVYAELARDAWHARSIADKVRVLFKPPGWRPADVAARFPKPAFSQTRALYNPPMSRRAQIGVVLLFMAALNMATYLLWFGGTLPLPTQAGGLLAVASLLYLAGVLAERRAEKRVDARNSTSGHELG
jgi:alkylglycerol monooxygenase